MNICTRTYSVSITYQGQTQTFTKHLSHDCHFTQEQINEVIIEDFFSEVMVEVDPTPFQEAKNYCAQQLNQPNSLSQDEIDIQNSLNRFCHIFPIENLIASVKRDIDTLPPCCPICGSKTFDGCPVCEDYL